MPYVASLDLISIDQAGKNVPVAFRLGAPERISSDEWRCQVSLDGLHDDLGFVHGSDGMQAISLALGLAAKLLREFVAHGGRLTYAAEESDQVDETEWPIESYFGWLGDSERRDGNGRTT
jgi:hypothetical protein